MPFTRAQDVPGYIQAIPTALSDPQPIPLCPKLRPQSLQFDRNQRHHQLPHLDVIPPRSLVDRFGIVAHPEPLRRILRSRVQKRSEERPDGLRLLEEYIDTHVAHAFDFF